MRYRNDAQRGERFIAEEKARLVRDLEQMIRDFEHMASEIGRQIEAEERRTGVRDPASFAYSTFAAAATQRRDNLRVSRDELRRKVEQAARDRDEALAKLACRERQTGKTRRTSHPSPAIAVPVLALK